MAVRRVTRPSTKEEVNLVLIDINKKRNEVMIGIPQYNARFTFVRHCRQRERWVEISSRQELQAGESANLHVSKSVFYGMAVWACAILNANRALDGGGTPVKIRRKKILWKVYWCADDGDHLQDTVMAYSSRDACILVAQLNVMLDNMYAIPVEHTNTVTKEQILPTPATPPIQLHFCEDGV